jgi:hypothetical protein
MNSFSPKINMNCIGGVMVSVLSSNVVDGGFEPQSGRVDREIPVVITGKYRFGKYSKF